MVHSRICKVCYDFHRLIVKEKRENPSLESIVVILDEKIKSFQSTSEVTSEKYLDLAVAKTALSLTCTLQKDEAVLLTVLYADFCEYLKTYAASSPPTTHWLLSALSIYFKDTLGMACKHRRYGTLLFLKGGDTLKALSKALKKQLQNT